MFCSVCKRQFKFKDNLIRHKQTHGKSYESFLECDDCHIIFDRPQDFAEHAKEHRPFECNICQKRFKTSNGLQ